MILHYYSPRALTHADIPYLAKAREAVLPNEQMQLHPVQVPGPGVLTFGDDPRGGTFAPHPDMFEKLLNPTVVLAHALAKYIEDGEHVYVPPFADRDTVWFDIETHEAEKRWDMPLKDYYRLGAYAINDGPVVFEEDPYALLDVLLAHPVNVAHNGWGFDFQVMSEGNPLLFLGRGFDTMVHAYLGMPAPEFHFMDSRARWMKSASPKEARRWYGLDNLAYQLGVPGKVGDLKALAKEFGGFGLIPKDDPRYREYLYNDIIALRETGTALFRIAPPNDYDVREQRITAVTSQITVNGFRVDADKAQSVADTREQRREQLLERLTVQYGMPTTGKKPWLSKAGKAAIWTALKERGIDPEEIEGWPKTKTGYSLGADALKEYTAGTDAEDFAAMIAEIGGSRTLAELTLSEMHTDEKVHPAIDPIQRSGRWSVTEPGLTVFDGRDKGYYLPDEGCKLVAFDFSNADARIVAAYSKDPEYMKRLDPSVDGHEISGREAYGDEEYEAAMLPGWETDLKIKKANPLRDKSKPLTHGWSYGGGPETLSIQSGVPLENTRRFVKGMARRYAVLVEWQRKVTREAKAFGYVTNAWGRRMRVVEGRESTQAPALYGQSGTREMMADALLRLLEFDDRLVRWCKVIVHDELIFSIPEADLCWAVPKIQELMTSEFEGIPFIVEHGDPADNWAEAGH